MTTARIGALLASGLVFFTLLSACGPASPPSVAVPVDEAAPPSATAPHPRPHGFGCASTTCQAPDQYCFVTIGGVPGENSVRGSCAPVPEACRSKVSCACLMPLVGSNHCVANGQDISFTEALP